MKAQNKMEYESPKFEFEEMVLTEKVADTCWGYAYAWYDADGNGSIDGGEKVDLSSLGAGIQWMSGECSARKL